MKKLILIAFFSVFLWGNDFNCADYINARLVNEAPELKIAYYQDKAAFTAARIALGVLIERCEVALIQGEEVSETDTLMLFRRKWKFFYDIEISKESR